VADRTANANSRKIPKKVSSSPKRKGNLQRIIRRYSVYAVSPAAAEKIVDVAATLGAPKRNALMNLIRGSVIREVSDLLPEEIDLLVYA
jgi:hypothetical protein